MLSPTKQYGEIYGFDKVSGPLRAGHVTIVEAISEVSEIEIHSARLA